MRSLVILPLVAIAAIVAVLLWVAVLPLQLAASARWLIGAPAENTD